MQDAKESQLICKTTGDRRQAGFTKALLRGNLVAATLVHTLSVPAANPFRVLMLALLGSSVTLMGQTRLPQGWTITP